MLSKICGQIQNTVFFWRNVKFISVKKNFVTVDVTLVSKVVGHITPILATCHKPCRRITLILTWHHLLFEELRSCSLHSCQCVESFCEAVFIFILFLTNNKYLKY